MLYFIGLLQNKACNPQRGKLFLTVVLNPEFEFNIIVTQEGMGRKGMEVMGKGEDDSSFLSLEYCIKIDIRTHCT